MLIQADAFHLPYRNNLFHACVFSPPYWGLRKYSGEQGEEPLGLESTPERHIERMVECLREVRRVLRDDGVVWLNYGDCFAGGGRGSGGVESEKQKSNTGSLSCAPSFKGIEAGNLMLMPHRLAIALQDDGWIVRNDLVWFKRNPMPESVAGWRWERKKTKLGNRGRGGEDWRDNATDTPQQKHAPDGSFLQDAIYEYSDDYVLRKSSWRHTRAHEYVFQLVKKMGYYCNQEAVREAVEFKGSGGISADDYEERKWAERSDGLVRPPMTMKHRNYSGRNPRSVLDVPTAPYKGAHYATFPPKLIAPLIRASVPRRCCPKCGMAWAPVVEMTQAYRDVLNSDGAWTTEAGKPDKETKRQEAKHPSTVPQKYNVESYRPTCECGVMEHEPGIVLDIFGGSGTTGMVAKELLRRWVVMDISMPYIDEQAKIRTGEGTPSKGLTGLPLFDGLSDAEGKDS